jgi:hypothetical protein
MSGGYFDHQQYAIKGIAESLDKVIRENKGDFGPFTLSELKEGLRLLELGYIYAQRVDWLLSDDDNEETFHKRMKQDIEAWLNERRTRL